MPIKFEPTSYTKAFVEIHDGESPESIYDGITRDLKFTYSPVKYQDFAKHHSYESWMTRKICVLPAITWLLSVQIIYHVSRMIFLALVNIKKGDFKPAKVQLYRIGRDFEEVFGQLISLFSDKYGSYIIQKNEFQCTCYEIFLEKHRNRYSNNENQTPTNHTMELQPVQDANQLQPVQDANQPTRTTEDVLREAMANNLAAWERGNQRYNEGLRYLESLRNDNDSVPET